MFFWPGYKGIVCYGYLSFLVTALVFAFILDLFLIVNFYWTDQITVAQRNIILLCLVVIWFILSSFSHFRLRQFELISAGMHEDKFKEALIHYLRGNWYEVEMFIMPRLKYNPNDVETLLLQATLYRHTERYSEALQILDKLLLLNGSNKWFAEIETEKILIREKLKAIKDE
ncbi:MAG: hypothetical protein LBE18_12910 [Planctomycetaceae bacterium]|jgi:tetratricopeptide (TPR) repeat protein|nr:hypothetical protein [Planctomycetaceae bacterium]